jgi:predicted RND superfamily exporter protein
MGVVMLGGILFSAILTFFVVPCAFYLFERNRVPKAEEQKTLEAPQTMQLEVQKQQKRQTRKALKALSGE